MSRLVACLLALSLVLAAPLRAQETVDLSTLSTAFRDLSDRIAPSVVQIFVSGYGTPQGVAATSSSLIPRRQGTGSGVILGAEGYIVTNYHVVEGAQRVQVALNPALSDRKRDSILQGQGDLLGAQIVGVDPETDLAVIRVPAEGLPAAPLADSDLLRPGEIVLAFGSPRGLENSVSMGIVSSVARQLKPEDPMIYIQTDAPINPGNSGGPLVNAAGEVVGINTLIFTESGGSEGLGFAAPSNIVRTVYEQIRASGRVRRGTIGVIGQTVNPVLARGLGLDREWGVIVGDVVPGGPADLSGVQPGDVVLSLDGKPMENARQLDVNLYRRSVGQVVVLEIRRGKETLEKRVPVIERSNDPMRFAGMVSPEQNLVPRLGILGIDLTPRIKQDYLPNLRRDRGVLVAALAADSPGFGRALFPGDVIYTLNGTAVPDLADLKQRIDAARAGTPVALQVEREGSLRFVSLVLE